MFVQNVDTIQQINNVWNHNIVIYIIQILIQNNINVLKNVKVLM